MLNVRFGADNLYHEDQRRRFRHEASLIRKTRPSRLRAFCYALATLLVAGTILIASGSAAQAAAPDSHVMATWNMQAGPDRWAGAYTLASTHDVVALQEVPLAAPAGSYFQGMVNGIEHYLWVQGDNGPLRHLYILRTTTRDLGMVTSWEPDNVLAIPGVYRPALGVVNRTDGILFASIHAASGGGNDAASLVRRVAETAFYQGFLDYAALGDFNRSPIDLPQLGLPGDARIYNGGQATQQSGNELDYMVSDVSTDRWQATVLPNYGSDHWPIRFGSLQGAAGPNTLTIHAANSGRLLNVYQGETANGTHVIQYHDDGADNSRWFLEETGFYSASGALVRIRSLQSGKCMDVYRGQSARPGDYMNIWDCHGLNGEPDPGGYQRDTQNFTLEHPVWLYPNMTMLRDNSTRLYANINRGETGDGTWVIQWVDQMGPIPVSNETFYLHPQ